MSSYLMHRRAVVVLFAHARWEAAWRRVDALTSFIRADTLSQCREAQREVAGFVAVVEVARCKPAELVAFLAANRQSGSRTFTILVGNSSLEALRWQLMECGADVVVACERQLAEAVRGARRRLARSAPPELSLRDRIWSKLPWGD